MLLPHMHTCFYFIVFPSLPQLLQDELAARSVQLERVKRAGRELVSTEESPSLKAVDILCTAGGSWVHWALQQRHLVAQNKAVGSQLNYSSAQNIFVHVHAYFLIFIDVFLCSYSLERYYS